MKYRLPEALHCAGNPISRDLGRGRARDDVVDLPAVRPPVKVDGGLVLEVADDGGRSFV